MALKKNTAKKPVVVVAPVVQRSPRPTGPGKTYQQDGHWVEKPQKTAILICVCGNRYLKTRVGQTTCVRCIITVR